MDDNEVYKKGFISIGNTKLNRYEMRKSLKPIEEYYFAGYINNDDFFSQSFGDFVSSIPYLILFLLSTEKTLSDDVLMLGTD